MSEGALGPMKGELAEGVVPGLLRELYVGRRNGTLHFQKGDESQRVRVRRGHIVNAHSSVVTERLGDILVKRGLLSPGDLARATDVVVKEKKRLGQVLVDLGLIDQSGLEDAVALHVHELLAKVFTWDEGTYAFEEEDEAPGDELTLKLSTAELILEAVQAVQDPDVISYLLGDLDRALALSEDPLLRFQQLALSPTDGFVLSRVDGSLTAREIEQMIPLPPEEVRKSLLGLLSTGIVEFKDKSEPRDKPAPPEAPASAPRPSGPPASAPPRAAASAEASPRSTPEAPRATPAVPSPPAPPPSAPAAPPPGAPPSPPPSTPAAPPPAASPPAPAPAPAADDPAAQRRQEVLDAYEGLATRNHFEILGIPRASSAADVKEAYFKLARRFHPDVHHSASLGDLRDQLEKVFIKLGEAYDVLKDTDKRRQYEERLGRFAGRPAQEAAASAAAAVPPPPDPEEEARLRQAALRKAEKLYDAEKYFDAIQLARPLVDTLPEKLKLRARLVLARCYLKNPNWAKDAEQVLLDAVRDTPKAAEPHLLLGTLYRDRNMNARAKTMFKRVVELNPDDDEAKQQLALLGGDDPPPPDDDQGGGLLKKLFRR